MGYFTFGVFSLGFWGFGVCGLRLRVAEEEKKNNNNNKIVNRFFNGFVQCLCVCKVVEMGLLLGMEEDYFSSFYHYYFD